MPLGSFTFVIDGDRLDDTEETSATVTLTLQGPTVLKDGTKLRFHTPLAKGANVSLPHSVELPTDTTGTDISTTIGYVATVSTPNGSQRTATFAARADGVTLYMASVVTLETVDPVEAAEYAARAELARDEAEAAAAAAQAVGDTNDTIMAGVDNDPASAFRVQQDARHDGLYVRHAEFDDEMTAVDADAGSAFRAQLDARIAATYAQDSMILNVKDYGATGDGVTDDTAEVAEALADVPAAGGCLYFPRGTYKLTSDLTISPDNITLRGDGEGSCIAFDGAGLVLDGATSAHVFRTTVSYLRVTRTGTVGAAIRLKGGGVGTGVARFGFNDVQAESTGGTAWLIEGSYIGTFTNIYGRNSALGLKITTDTATGVVGGNLLTFVGGEFQGNQKAGELTATAGVTFLGTGWEGNTSAGMELLDNCRAVTFVNPYCEANASYDLKVGTTVAAYGLRVTGGYWADGGMGKAQSILLVRGQAIDIGGCFFSGFGANSPISVQEASAGAVRGEVSSECWSNGSAAIVALNGAARFTKSKRLLRASATLDFPSLAAGASANQTITVPGAATGDDATIHYNGTPPAGVIPFAWVSGVDEVTFRLTNATNAAIDPPSATVRVNVWKA